MKVDVNIVKRTGVKVEVNLARGSRHLRRVVNVPVRVAPYLAEDFEDTDVADGAASAADHSAPAEQPIEPETCPDFSDNDDIPAPCEPDDADQDEYRPDETCVCGDEPAEEVPDADMIGEEQYGDPDEEELLRLIAEEEAEMAASGQGAGYAVISEGHYMRYFDRSETGDIFEVSDDHAIGQEIICIDEESGRLSRVCGIIRNNQPSPSYLPDEEE